MDKIELVKRSKKASRVNKDNLLLQACVGKTVLDVGCLGQDESDYDSGNWLHEKLKSIATQVDGVDVHLDQIKSMRSEGYSIYTPEELEIKNKKFDVIVMGDVIEHVNNPVDFLTYYAQFLLPDGRIIVTTPNANRSNDPFTILLYNDYSVNPDHVFWLCPKTLWEVVNRTNLFCIKEFYWLDYYPFSVGSRRSIRDRLLFFIIRQLSFLRKNLSPNMAAVLTLKK